MAQKVGLQLEADKLPALPENLEIGGNEIEAMMVRVQRLTSLNPDSNLYDHLAVLLREYRPLSHKRILEYMDLVAVKECTDQTFLPPLYSNQPAEAIDGRLEQLKHELRIS